ncbi:MAG TPA: putative toxin-antitoxin system toxin component, PIN family [Acetobacteraceae bacterium]
MLDTSVLFAGLRSNLGASSRLIDLVADRIVTPLVSTPLFLEYEDVLKRPEQLRAMATTEAGVEGFLSALASASEAVEIHYKWRPQLRDPGDEMVLETAINGRAAALVTHNLRDLAGAGQRFGIQVIRPGEALRRCRI